MASQKCMIHFGAPGKELRFKKTVMWVHAPTDKKMISRMYGHLTWVSETTYADFVYQLKIHDCTVLLGGRGGGLKGLVDRPISFITGSGFCIHQFDRTDFPI